jgi:uncharacterized protein RhaS with RHS repeats
MRAPYEGIVISPRVRGYSVRRYYDPQTGQFISVDPAVDQTEAPYAYVNGDPVDGADPLGLGCFLGICTHSFDPMASLDAWVNIGRGATFGLTDRIANWIVPGASCTVAQNSLDQLIGSAATVVLAGALAAAPAAEEGGTLVDQTLADIRAWVGDDARVIQNDDGDTTLVSRDGTRKIRIDVNRTYPHESPHAHVEELVNGKWQKSGPIYPVDVPQR